ncbi:DUF2390 domain-containing protein [Marinobacteraceae bacterium S3BR75-40.1]
MQPPKPDLDLDNPLWRLALTLWQQPAFASAALTLQARGWRVSHLLVACFMARQGRRWDGQEPATIRQWRETMTEALRTRRQALPKEREDLASLRQALAEAELQAEKVELAWWHQSLSPGDGRDHQNLIPNLVTAAPSPQAASEARSLLQTLCEVLSSCSGDNDEPLQWRQHLAALSGTENPQD